jgi:hypothetical protein
MSCTSPFATSFKRFSHYKALIPIRVYFSLYCQVGFCLSLKNQDIISMAPSRYRSTGAVTRSSKLNWLRASLNPAESLQINQRPKALRDRIKRGQRRLWIKNARALTMKIVMKQNSSPTLMNSSSNARFPSNVK